MPNKSKPNRLINEKSPYLLQHAHTPVDWYPWGEEAFEKAKRENKPVLVNRLFDLSLVPHYKIKKIHLD
ncbi:YyaL [Bacillus subtilis subsp. subtilis]|nr:YyaL [Bacillus subtilis subsp. subtilis]